MVRTCTAIAHALYRSKCKQSRKYSECEAHFLQYSWFLCLFNTLDSIVLNGLLFASFVHHRVFATSYSLIDAAGAIQGSAPASCDVFWSERSACLLILIHDVGTLYASLRLQYVYI